MTMMSLSLSWIYQRDRVLLIVKFELKKIILFKYCVDVENCESFRSFNYIYIYIYRLVAKLCDARESSSKY